MGRLGAIVGVVVGVLLVQLLLWVGYVGATANPDSISVGDVFVFEDVLEAGDSLTFMRYDVAYASQPDEDSEDTFQMAIYDTDGTTLLFVRPLNYYQHNIISIYLSASENTLVTGGAYYVRVMGSPAIFTLIENVTMDTRVLAPGDYYEADLLGGMMISQAEILEVDWAITLVSEDKLNSTGSYYFDKAIPGLASMAPEIFSTSTVGFTYEPTTYNQTGLNKTLQNLPVSLNNATTGLDEMFGVTNHNFGQFGWLGFAGLIVGGGVYGATRRPDIALFGGVMGVCGLSAYLGVAEGNMLRFVMSVGAVIIVLFALDYILPRYG